MSKSTTEPKIKKIRVIKKSEIKPKIKKINKKTDVEIQTITDMFSQITINTINENIKLKEEDGKTMPMVLMNESPSKKRKSPTPPLIDSESTDCCIEAITNKMAKLSISALNIPLLESTRTFSTPHFATIPIYIDLNTIKSNYQKNLKEDNPAKLYQLYTRFLFEGPFTMDINEQPDESIDINIYLQDKYGIDEDNVSLISEISIVPNLTIYVAYVKKFLVVPTVYSWKACIDLYNHIQESYQYHSDNLYPIKPRGVEYNYEENPYKAILNNAGTNLVERDVSSIIRLGHLYQNIMENYQTLLEINEN